MEFKSRYMQKMFIANKKRMKEKISDNLKKNILNKPLDYRYQMLSRFQQDADYFFRNPSPKHLWSGDPIEHADNMMAIYNSFSEGEKPEWLSLDQLKKYVKKLKTMKESRIKEADTSEIISDLIDLENVDTDEEKGKFKELISGLIFSDDVKAKKFLKAINDFTSGLDKEDF